MTPHFHTDQQLVERLRSLATEVATGRAELAERLRTETSGELLRATPVRTGRLRDGWAEPNASTTESDAAARSIRTLANQTPYAGYVEYGTSRQAPQRIVSAALRRVARLAKQFVRLDGGSSR